MQKRRINLYENDQTDVRRLAFFRSMQRCELLNGLPLLCLTKTRLFYRLEFTL